MTNGFVKTDNGWVFRVVETTEFTQSYETAAWYSTIEVPAGDYPATFRKPNGAPAEGPEDGWWANARLDGRRTYNYFPSLFAGNPIGGGDIGPCDEPATYYIQSYAFSLKDKAAA
jgi:hypothetical protein